MSIQEPNPSWRASMLACVPEPITAAPELSIVVPTYREAQNIATLVSALKHALSGIHWEVIFVDDDSPDGTVDVIRSLGGEDIRIRGIRRLARRGLSGAAIEGICASSSEYVAVMDCDLQHDERLLPKMLKALNEGADLVVASRYVTGASSHQGLSKGRRWGSQLATQLSRRLLRADTTDPLSGHFMMRRRDFDLIAPKLSTSGFKLLLDLLLSSPRQMTIKEFGYDFRPRHAGTSKLDGTVVAEFLGLLVTRASGGRVSPRFPMFALVGASGVGIHLAVLYAVLNTLSPAFQFAQLISAYAAMTWNFFLNNSLTYRDKRLDGLAALKGLVSFYLICSVGTVANVGVARLVYDSDPNWILAGMAGALMAAVFNFAMTSAFTWGKNS